MLPEGEMIQGMTAQDFIYEGVDHSFRLLLRSIYALLNPPHIQPFICGYFDMPNWYIEALSYFKSGESLYRDHHKNISETLKRLGAK